MGDKIASKKLANEAKVSTIPGYNDAIESPSSAVEIAKGIGYPVMIKAARLAVAARACVGFNDKEAFEGFTSCRNEARNSFGDDRVFIEKYRWSRATSRSRCWATHGNVVYLNERECSIQRRHQKVIEEAPSPFISEATARPWANRPSPGQGREVPDSAGTVEFVVGKDQDFYFLEMNTRLQVEHPVTECITGLDLVELMIRVAAGEKLPSPRPMSSAMAGPWMPHQCRGSVSQLPAQHRTPGALCATTANHVAGQYPGLAGCAGGYRRDGGRRDSDVLRLDDCQAHRARHRPQMTPSPRCAKPSTVL